MHHSNGAVGPLDAQFVDKARSTQAEMCRHLALTQIIAPTVDAAHLRISVRRHFHDAADTVGGDIRRAVGVQKDTDPMRIAVAGQVVSVELECPVVLEYQNVLISVVVVVEVGEATPVVDAVSPDAER